MTPQNNPSQINPATLRDLMAGAYFLDDLPVLCMDIGVDYDNIPGGDIKINRIIGLIEYMQHNNRLPELLAQLRKQRPQVDWDAAILSAGPESASHLVAPPASGAASSKRWLWGGIALAGILLFAAAAYYLTSGQTCAYHQADDYATILQIIHAESQAVNQGNLDTIKEIFAPDAAIKFTETIEGKTNIQEWTDPLSRYSPLFASTTFSDARHTDIEGSITGNYARFTSGSSGSYVNEDGYGEYKNKAGIPDEEEVWTLEKNFWGCWQITRFEFH